MRQPANSGEFVEASVWKELCELLRNPERLEEEHQQKLAVTPSPENTELLAAELRKLQRGMERLIDSYSEGVIEKEQFMSRMTRTKGRIEELEAKIRASTGTADAGLGLRLLVEYYQKFSAHLGSELGRCGLEPAEGDHS